MFLCDEQQYFVVYPTDGHGADIDYFDTYAEALEYGQLNIGVLGEDFVIKYGG